MKKTTLLITSLFATVLLFTGFRSPSKNIKNGYDLIKAVYKKYNKLAARNITFQQETVFYKRDGSVARKQVWYEAMQAPGKLHIRMGEFDKGNGALYRDGKLYHIREGKVVKEKAEYNELMVLATDMYFRAPKATAKILEDLNFDLSKMHETTWKGRKVYVIGAEKGDTTSNQFWFDTENLYFVRMLNKKPHFLLDVYFDEHQKVGNAWMERKVIVKIGDKLYMTETYSQVKAHKSLDAAIFKPETFSKSKW